MKILCIYLNGKNHWQKRTKIITNKVLLNPFLVFIHILTQISYLIIKFQISRTIVTSICYGGSKLPNYFYSTLLRSCVNIEFSEKRGPKQTLNCILLSRPWSSRIDYFKNNKQNLSSHLKLTILENNRLLLENSQFSACYFDK